MRLFDTATKTLAPVDPPGGHVGMYFCGPTGYARAHVGNARPFVLGMPDQMPRVRLERSGATGPPLTAAGTDAAEAVK